MGFPVENHLLGLLPEDELQSVLPHLERVSLDFRAVAYDASGPIEYAYFPEDGMISIVGLADKRAVEVALVGNEGVIGVPLFLGADRTAGQAFTQIAGRALRMPSQAFKRATSQGKLREVLQHYTHALFIHVAQAAACNRLHLTEQRFARWLLMTHDRIGRPQFTLKQAFLSQMLGVRRATVSEIAAEVQRNGAIRYSRGQMTIVERNKLEDMTCECYSMIRKEYERLLGKPQRNPPLRAHVPSRTETSPLGEAGAGGF